MRFQALCKEGSNKEVWDAADVRPFTVGTEEAERGMQSFSAVPDCMTQFPLDTSCNISENQDPSEYTLGNAVLWDWFLILSKSEVTSSKLRGKSETDCFVLDLAKFYNSLCCDCQTTSSVCDQTS